MDSNHIIQSMWIGARLSPIERLGITSFLRNGHEFHLYTYGKVDNVPEGTIIKDANEILPTTTLDYKLFTKLAIFADYFRYKLLIEKGGWWVDTDTVCIRPFDIPNEYVFSSEVKAINNGKHIIGTQVNNGNIKAPKDSPIMRYLWDRCWEMNPAKIAWGASGPALIEAAVNKFNLQDNVFSPQAFCPIMAWDVKKYVDPNTTLTIPPEAYAVHLWNECWAWAQMDKNATYPAGCALEQLKRKYNDTIPNVIQSLWVGDKLSTMEQLSAASYIYHGEDFHLYTYGPCKNVPDGVVIKDANEIVPEEDINKFQNLANFSDWFRYNLLYEKGNWWVDLDTVLLRPFDTLADHVFVNQYPDRGHKDQVNGDFIKAPKKSFVMKWLIDECLKLDWKTNEWSDIGPNLLTRAIHHFSLPILPCNFSFHPFAPEFVGRPLTVPEDTYAIHLVRNNWFGVWAGKKKLDPDVTYPSTCLYEQLKKKFLPAPQTDTNLTTPWLKDTPIPSFTEHVPVSSTVMRPPVWTQHVPDPNWRDKIIGDKVNRAVSRGYKVAAICGLGSAYHMELRRVMPRAMEENIETPEGDKVLMLIK